MRTKEPITKPQDAVLPTVTTTILLLALLLSACIVKDSPAPGCIEYLGAPPVGGCFGKTAILDLRVEPAETCLDITVNNCNGGVLEIHNGCDEAFILGGVTISPSDRANLDVVPEGTGHALVEVSSNFSTYVPEVDERVELVGTLGDQQVQVSFSKTRQLCE
jgi:hypothetical protein